MQRKETLICIITSCLVIAVLGEILIKGLERSFFMRALYFTYGFQALTSLLFLQVLLCHFLPLLIFASDSVIH